MPKISQFCVERVKAAADIVQVCQAWGVVLKKSGSGWSGKCPFHSEKSGSFSVREGKGAKCFGCGWSGDAIKFVMQSEGCDFQQAIEKLAGKFGVLLEFDRPSGPVENTKYQVSSDKSDDQPLTEEEIKKRKALERAAKRIAKMDAVREAEQRMEKHRLEALKPRIVKRKLFGWSSVVRAHWAKHAGLTGDRAEELAAERGWPAAWVYWLLDEDLIAWPELPWNEVRAVAFRVDAPVIKIEGDRFVLTELRPIGYHQRRISKGRKIWGYIPSIPGDDFSKSEFQLAMVAAELSRGVDTGESLVPGLPFFMGAREGVRLLVIAEGQWDAVTFAGSAGWLDCESAWPEGVAVMGIRGSTGFETMLAYWGDWIFAQRKTLSVLVLADNDVAGKKWSVVDQVPLGQCPGPTFADKLLHAGARRVQVQRVRAEFGKDFNDYFKVRKPSSTAISELLRSLGFIGAGGAWL